MKRHPIAVVAVLFSSLAILGSALSAPTMAQERRERVERHDRHDRGGRHEGRDFYRSPHWVYDNRYHHGHYYPAPGYTLSALPPGYASITFGRGHYFFQGGVWYRRGPTAGFVVVRPPLGIVLPALPLGYTTLWWNGVPYYYANDIFYTGTPGNYVVVEPPPGLTTEAPLVERQDTAPPPPTPSAALPPQNPAVWYYCESAKGYYPYVPECREGWRAVPATPPSAR